MRPTLICFSAQIVITQNPHDPINYNNFPGSFHAP